MKKLYTILLSAAVALGASAATPTLSVAKELQNVSLESLQETPVRNLELKSTTSLLKRIKGAPAKADAVTWTDLGEGKFSDGWYLPRYGITSSDFKWPVKVMKSSEGEIYKFVDPFHAAEYKALFTGANIQFPFTDEAHDVIVDCTNPDFVKLQFGIGMVIDKTAKTAGFGTLTEDTPLYLSTYANYFTATGTSEAVITTRGFNNTFAEGKITLPLCIFGVGTSTETSAQSAFGDASAAELMIPGAKDYSFTGYINTECVTDLKLSFSVSAGADITTAKYAIMAGLYAASADNFEYLDANNALSALPAPTGNWNLTYKAAPDNGEYTLFLAGYNAEGKMVGTTTAYYIVDIDTPEDWTSVGTCQFTEDLIGNLYQNSSNVAWGTTTYEVEVQENIATPGLFRIVNPYTGSWPHVANNDHETDHDHFLLIDATNPEKVNIPQSYIGFDGGYGHEYLVSINNLAEDEADVDATLWGKFADKTITLPAKSVYDATLLDGTPYTVGKGEFKLVLPDTYGGVLGVDADADVNAPVEFFNLQGVRVANPTEGQLVIRRQGTKVEKVVLK